MTFVFTPFILFVCTVLFSHVCTTKCSVCLLRRLHICSVWFNFLATQFVTDVPLMSSLKHDFILTVISVIRFTQMTTFNILSCLVMNY